VYDARGFVIGWNLNDGDYINNKRVLTVDECTGDYCNKVSDLTEAEKVNYANWYSYHRTKNRVMKGSLSQVILGSQNEGTEPFVGRAGVAIFNDFNRVQTNSNGVRSKGVGKIISNIDSNDARFELLEEIYKVRAAGGTPLRAALMNAGEYYSIDGTNGNAVQNLFGEVDGHDATETISTDSPILNGDSGGYCQKNYTIMFTDGEWTRQDDAILNFVDTDSNGPGVWDDHPSFRDDEDGGVGPNSLADVAMHYFERDLAPNVPDEVVNTDSRFDGRPIPHQHMITTGITFGVEGKIPFINPRVDFPFDPLSVDFTGWGDNRTDDLAHAAWNSRGSFYGASDGNELVRAFNQSLQGGQTQITTSSASLNTSRVDTSGGSFSYRSFYDTVYSGCRWSSSIYSKQCQCT